MQESSSPQNRLLYLFHFITVILLPLISGCITLPSASTESIDDKLSLVKPLNEGETIVIYGFSASPPKYFADGYFTMNCGMKDSLFFHNLGFHKSNIDRIANNMLKYNPVRGKFAIIAPDNVVGDYSETSLIELEEVNQLNTLRISKIKALQEHLRYVINIDENVDTTLHVPLYIPPFGFIECGNKSTLKATVWEVPSGKLIGTVTYSSEGEFIVLGWLVHFIFTPDTQDKVTWNLIQGMLKTLTGVTPDMKE